MVRSAASAMVVIIRFLVRAFISTDIDDAGEATSATLVLGAIAAAADHCETTTGATVADDAGETTSATLVLGAIAALVNDGQATSTAATVVVVTIVTVVTVVMSSASALDDD